MIENKFKLGQKVKTTKHYGEDSYGIYYIKKMTLEMNKLVYELRPLRSENAGDPIFRYEADIEIVPNEAPEVRIGMVVKYGYNNELDNEYLIQTNYNNNTPDITIIWNSIEDYRNDKRLWER